MIGISSNISLNISKVTTMISVTHHFIGFYVISVADQHLICNVFLKFCNLVFVSSMFCPSCSVSHPVVHLDTIAT